MLLCWQFSSLCSCFGLGFTFFEQFINIFLGHDIFDNIGFLSEILSINGFIKLHG